MAAVEIGLAGPAEWHYIKIVTNNWTSQLVLSKAAGLLAGLSIAFIGIIADRLIGTWAARRKRELGIL